MAKQSTDYRFETTAAFADQLDAEDSLRQWREQFHFPKQKNGENELYLVGNSLGLQPNCTAEYLNEELERWKSLGVRGHFEGPYPWMPYHEFLTEPMANLIGANTDEVVMMNSLTTNLHLMMATFYRPTPERNKIVIEQNAFPSDHYAVESQIKHHGFDPADSLLLFKPRPNSELLNVEDLFDLIDRHSQKISLIMLPGVQYYSGQVLEMHLRIVEKAHQHEIMIGFDLAHAAGNIPMQLHGWNVDFAVWCTYKYLNSGPGSVGGCFIHSNHCRNLALPRLAGWWGHDKKTRFQMKNEFHPMPTAEGWQLSNPPILSLAAIRASLNVFTQAGGMKPLHEKSVKLTSYFRWLLQEKLAEKIGIITPQENGQFGCQLSLKIAVENGNGKRVHETLEKCGVMTDWRKPNVIRAAPVPLYNSFIDVFQTVEILEQILTINYES